MYGPAETFINLLEKRLEREFEADDMRAASATARELDGFKAWREAFLRSEACRNR